MSSAPIALVGSGEVIDRWFPAGVAVGLGFDVGVAQGLVTAPLTREPTVSVSP